MPGELSHRDRPRGLVALVALAVAVVPAVVACGDDGTELRAPRPDQTTTTTEAAPSDGDTAAEPGVEAGSASDEAESLPTVSEPLALTSPAFGDGEAIPRRHTCRGADVSPPLQWGEAPDGTVELAVVVRDVDAEDFLHWVIAGLPPDLGGLAEDTVPEDAVEATNDFGRPGWGGPCPPSGSHEYELRVYALGEPSGVEVDQPGVEALAAIEARPALGSSVLNGTASAD